jgi:hypothetical protein
MAEEAHQIWHDLCGFLKRYQHMDRDEAQACEELNEQARCHPKLVLAKGVRVLLSTNLDVEHGLSSGKLGTIETVDPETHYPTIRWDDGSPAKSEIHPFTWQAAYRDGYVI